MRVVLWLAALCVLATGARASVAWQTTTPYVVEGALAYRPIVDPGNAITGVPLSVSVGTVYTVDIAASVSTDIGEGMRQYGMSIGGQAACATEEIQQADSVGTGSPKAVRVTYTIMCTAANSETRDYTFVSWGTYALSDALGSRSWVLAPTTSVLTSVPALTSIQIVPLVSLPVEATFTTKAAFLAAI